MRLKSISIKNFRAINGGKNIIKFDKNNIVFIFGKNNIGKSSILHAYKYFSSPTEKALITDFYNNDPKNNIVMEATFIKEDSDLDKFNDLKLNKWVDKTTGMIKVRKTWSKEGDKATKETYDPNDGQYKLNGFGGLDTILTSATPNIILIEAMPNISLLAKWLDDKIKSELLASLKLQHKAEYDTAISAIEVLQQKAENNSYLTTMADSANTVFNSTFPEFEIKITQDKSKGVDLTKSFEKYFNIVIGKKGEEVDTLLEAAQSLDELSMKENDSYRNFSLHGHALIRQAIVTLLGIFGNTKEGEKHIILFEEPELYLHPSNKRRFRETLYELANKENYQVICISHDPQLIDLSKEHMSLARFVQLENGETEIYQTDDNIFNKDNETKNKVQMLNRFNPHICESFFADEVILVEGDTEAIVLRELIQKHYADKELFVLNTGSKNNIPFFINVLSNFKIKQHIIHDSDERYLYDKAGIRKTNADGTYHANSAWSMNQNIWDTMQAAQARNGCNIRRYVSFRNFEDAHNYKHDADKGKPLSAYLYAQKIGIDDDANTIVNQLKQIVGDTHYSVNFTQEYLDKNVPEPTF